jgi:hypothetical protein
MRMLPSCLHDVSCQSIGCTTLTFDIMPTCHCESIDRQKHEGKGRGKKTLRPLVVAAGMRLPNR